MSTVLDPIVSGFETEEQQALHDEWLRRKLQAALDDPRPSVPHDEAMARIQCTIANARANLNAAAVA